MSQFWQAVITVGQTAMSPVEQMAADGKFVAAVLVFLFTIITGLGAFLTKVFFVQHRMLHKSMDDAKKEREDLDKARAADREMDRLERRAEREIFSASQQKMVETLERNKDALVALQHLIEKIQFRRFGNE